MNVYLFKCVTFVCHIFVLSRYVRDKLLPYSYRYHWLLNVKPPAKKIYHSSNYFCYISFPFQVFQHVKTPRVKISVNKRCLIVSKYFIDFVIASTLFFIIGTNEKHDGVTTKNKSRTGIYLYIYYTKLYMCIIFRGSISREIPLRKLSFYIVIIIYVNMIIMHIILL